jgi:hypothetical protein
MELRHLRYFVAAVEWKSLREASRRIHVAQPAISQTISNLESEIGVELLTRSGRRSVNALQPPNGHRRILLACHKNQGSGLGFACPVGTFLGATSHKGRCRYKVIAAPNNIAATTRAMAPAANHTLFPAIPTTLQSAEFRAPSSGLGLFLGDDIVAGQSTHSTLATSVYPLRGTVSISVGIPPTSPSACRSWFTVVFIFELQSSGSFSGHNCARSDSRVTISPGFSSNAVSTTYILPTSRICTSFLVSTCLRKSRWKSPNLRYRVGKVFSPHSSSLLDAAIISMASPWFEHTSEVADRMAV